MSLSTVDWVRRSSQTKHKAGEEKDSNMGTQNIGISFVRKQQPQYVVVDLSFIKTNSLIRGQAVSA